MLGTLSRNVLLVFYALFALFPLIWMLILSFKPDDQMSTTTFIFSPTLDNFRAVLGQEGFLKTLWNNLLVSSLAVALSLIVGVPAAYALGRYQFKGREDIAFTFLSLRFPPEILVIIPLYLIYQKLNLIDSFFGLIWVYQLISLPLLIWVLRGFLRRHPSGYRSGCSARWLFLVAGFLQGGLAARQTRDRLGSAALFYLLLEFIHFRPAARRGFNADFDGVSHEASGL